MKENGRKALEQFNIDLDGTMEVRLPARAKALPHHAYGTQVKLPAKRAGGMAKGRMARPG